MDRLQDPGHGAITGGLGPVVNATRLQRRHEIVFCNYEVLRNVLRDAALGTNASRRVVQPRAARIFHVVVLNRDAKAKSGRALTNGPAILAALQAAKDELGLSVHPNVVVSSQLNVRAMARLLDRADVLITPHGAQASNMVFMRPGALVLQLVPYRCERMHTFFEAMAAYLGLQHDWLGPGSYELSETRTAADEAWANRARAEDSNTCRPPSSGTNWERDNFAISPANVLGRVWMHVAKASQQ